MRARKAEIDAAGAEVWFVAFSPWSELERFQETEADDWPCLHDPERRAYAAYGLGRASLVRLLDPRLWRVAARAPRRPGGRWHGEDLLQLGGDFVVGPDGRLRLAWRSANPADRPSVDLLLERLQS